MAGLLSRVCRRVLCRSYTGALAVGHARNGLDRVGNRAERANATALTNPSSALRSAAVGTHRCGLRSRTSVTSTMLMRMMPRPSSVLLVSGSPKSSAAVSSANAGTRNVTLCVLVGPSWSIRRRPNECNAAMLQNPPGDAIDIVVAAGMEDAIVDVRMWGHRIFKPTQIVPLEVTAFQLRMRIALGQRTVDGG
jgi:hypothetical protein